MVAPGHFSYTYPLVAVVSSRACYWITVEQPLALRPLDRQDHPRAIAYATMIPHERSLVAVAMQVLLAEMVMYNDTARGAT